MADYLTEGGRRSSEEITEPHELRYSKCVRVENKKKIWRAVLDKLLG